jgi:hypothetical protein
MTQGQIAANAGGPLTGVAAKSAFRVDGYFVDLGMAPERLTRRSAYWYSMWSHRRSQLWKGFVQVDLAPTDDVVASATLAKVGGLP